MIELRDVSQLAFTINRNGIRATSPCAPLRVVMPLRGPEKEKYSGILKVCSPRYTRTMYLGLLKAKIDLLLGKL